MKIGYDAKRAFNNTSGLGNYSRDVIRAVKKYFNDELYLFTTKINEELFDVKDVKIIEPGNKLTKAYWRTFYVSNDINKLNLDIFHGLSNEIPVGINSNVKKVITVHDLIFKRFPQWYNFIDRKIYDKKVAFGLKTADKIIAISRQTKNDIIEFYGTEEDKIEVVYQTCNDIFKKKADDLLTRKVKDKYNLPEKYLLYVGTIEPRKNALNIVKALYERNIDIPLIIVGRNTKYGDIIKEYIKNKLLENRIFLLHDVQTDELPVFYQNATVFIYPSTFEGFGIPIIEALYSGIPVITSKGGCFAEAGGKGSIYVNPENINELAEAITELLNDESKRKELIKEGKKHVKNFETGKVATALHNVYEALVMQ